jgi:glucosamine 6-phosphate synthetase-like amidotransferase/phosphosugar isomerase protein
MLSDILRQPEVLSSLLARRADFLALGRSALVPRSGGRLFGFGCGDGWFAARVVCGQAGRGYVAATSLKMVLSRARLSADDRAIAISMSGSVDRTNEAAATIVGAGGTCVALTNADGGTLGQIASEVASLHVPDVEKFLTGTTRYSATVLALMFLLEGAGMSAVVQPEPVLAAFLAETLPTILNSSAAFCETLCAELVQTGIGGIRLLGAGTDWATGDYGAAKLLKLVNLPVWSSEIEEFAHSQFWGARQNELIVLLAGSDAAATLAENTASALKEAGMGCLAIESAGSAVPSAKWRLSLPASAVSLAPLALAAALQMLAYHLAKATGGAPDTRQDVASPGRFLAAQMLSRRCELAVA